MLHFKYINVRNMLHQSNPDPPPDDS